MPRLGEITVRAASDSAARPPRAGLTRLIASPVGLFIALLILLLVASLLAVPSPVAFAQQAGHKEGHTTGHKEEKPGEAIYQQECARCHGAAGQGAKKYPRPLVGDWGPTRLAAVIARTMPEDDPGGCSGDEARDVAAFIYDAFYSPDAQARANPPRVSLSRLTVRQYRNAVADVIGSFRPPAKPDGRRGLRGEYFNSKNFQNDKRLIDRLDAEVRFDFRTDGPDVGSAKVKFSPHQFCVRWEGSVLAPETGTYEFVVRTEHALRLWVNDPRKPLIDAMVKSGSDREYRASIFLIAGRPYSLRLEIAKGRQLGPKDKNPPPTQASVELLWRLPHRADEIIPSRQLSPARSPEVAVVETPFPPDDRSYGWERGSTISKEWVGATADAALEVAGYVAARLPELAGAPEAGAERGPKLRAFCRAFAERAFRRPLTDAEARELVGRAFEGVGDKSSADKGAADKSAADMELAVKRVVIRVMTSPAFLYPSTAGGPGGYAVASRLALVLWDSSPDPALLAAAAAGKLSTPEEIAAQARRMLDDPRARAKVREFLLAWLRLDQSPELLKDAKRFPGFDAPLAADLRTSLEMFLDDVTWGEASDFRQLLLSDETFLNGRLAAFYGAALPADAGFTKVKLDPGKRAGVLTHPYLLAALAYPAESSPIHRGVFVLRGLLGVTLRPPPQAFTPLPAELHPGLTTRERIALQTSPVMCASCHSAINPLGFALEQFDAVGKPREEERGKGIDVRGRYETREGSVAEFAGARQLAAFLAGSKEVQGAFTQQLFQHFVKQPVRAYGLQLPTQLRQKFVASDYNIRQLLVEIAVIASGPL